jgi:FKBP-type peptidyl-prolyl cis-trans isomerase SlyD
LPTHYEQKDIFMKPKVISFHYTLTDPTGETLDSSVGKPPLTFMQGVGQIIPGLEAEIGKMKVGDKKKIEVKAGQAYGERDPQAVIEVPIEKMPKQEIHVGEQFRAAQHPTPLTVTKVTATHVTLDANHPLAGMDLTFDVEVTEIRNATDEEKTHGHAHGPGGHHHH